MDKPLFEEITLEFNGKILRTDLNIYVESFTRGTPSSLYDPGEGDSADFVVKQVTYIEGEEPELDRVELTDITQYLSSLEEMLVIEMIREYYDDRADEARIDAAEESK